MRSAACPALSGRASLRESQTVSPQQRLAPGRHSSSRSRMARQLHPARSQRALRTRRGVCAGLSRLPGAACCHSDVLPGRERQEHLGAPVLCTPSRRWVGSSGSFCLCVHRSPTGSATKESGIKRTWGSFKKRPAFTRLARWRTPPKSGARGARPAARPQPAPVSEAAGPGWRSRACGVGGSARGPSGLAADAPLSSLKP